MGGWGRIFTILDLCTARFVRGAGGLPPLPQGGVHSRTRARHGPGRRPPVPKRRERVASAGKTRLFELLHSLSWSKALFERLHCPSRNMRPSKRAIFYPIYSAASRAKVQLDGGRESPRICTDRRGLRNANPGSAASLLRHMGETRIAFTRLRKNDIIGVQNDY